MAVSKKNFSSALPGGGTVKFKTKTKKGKRFYDVTTPAGTRTYSSRKAAYSHYRSIGGTGGGGAG